MKRVSAALAGIVLILAAWSGARAAGSAYTYTSLGANYTPSGINNAGTIVGRYGQTVTQGFILSGGTYTLFDYPNEPITVANGISNAGTIVGIYTETNDVSYGFTRSNGSYAVLNGYSGATYTGFEGINNAGTIVGFYWDTQGTLHGFTGSGGAYSSVDYSGAIGTSVFGINDAGTIVGTYSTGKTSHGFTLGNGAYTTVDYPGATSTSAYGINNAGAIVGTYLDANKASHGFVLNAGTYTSVDRPGGAGTVLWGINSAGTIIGTDNSGGFMATSGVTLSGTVTAEKCTTNSCATAPFPGVLIDVTSTAASYQATTASDGTYSVQVATGNTYTLTPSYTNEVGFSPPSRLVTPIASVNNLDFIACVQQLPTAESLHEDFETFLARRPLASAASCDPDAMDWSMPKLIKPGVTFTANNVDPVYGLLSADPYVYPSKGWDVNLFLTAAGVPGGAPSCDDPNTQWRWQVTGPSKILKQPAPGCETSMTVEQLGTYNVTAVKYTRSSSSAQWTQTSVKLPAKSPQKVMARNFIVVGLGDSNASGEGNPPFFFNMCNRSVTSYQYKAAYDLQEANQHASVTFLFPACSGARIEHLYNRSYQGINPDPGGFLLPSQTKQVNTLLTFNGSPGGVKNPRSVDAVILSIGVNNLYFGSVVKFGLLNGQNFEDMPVNLVSNGSAGAGRGAMSFVSAPASQTTVAQQLAKLQTQLDNLYPPLATSISAAVGSGGLGAPRENVIITQYPDFTHDANGDYCDTSTNWFSLYNSADVPQWNASDWAWFSRQAKTLDDHVANTSASCGWTVAQLDNTSTGPFYTHGYCAGSYGVLQSPFPPFVALIPSFGQSYFLGVIGGLNPLNFDQAGPFHPLDLGHGATAEAVDPLLCTALYGNPACSGTPLPPK